MIYAYSLPAILAFMFKTMLLVRWGRTPAPNTATRLFLFAVVVAMLLNSIEVGGFQGLFGNPPSENAARIYHIVLLALLTLLTHLTFEVAFEEKPTLARRWLIQGLYFYSAVLGALIAFTPLVMAGFEVLDGYTLTRVPGPLYPLCEIFAAITLLTITLLPLRSVHSKSGRLRNRCRIWILAAAPACLLVILVLALLRLDLKLFNASVTLPIPMTLLLYAIGYCIHSKQLIDPFAYFPFTKARPSKRSLHTSLAGIVANGTPTRIDELLQRLSSAIGCEIYLAEASGTIVAKSAGANPELRGIPFDTIEEMLLTPDASDSLRSALRRQRIGAIVPLFATSTKLRSWLVFGAEFDASIYTPSDFRLLNEVVRTLAGLLLDERATCLFSAVQSEASLIGSNDAGDTEPLYARLAAYEAFLITQALKSTNGNQARAARLLGLQPNTLYYKIQRHGLDIQKR